MSYNHIIESNPEGSLPPINGEGEYVFLKKETDISSWFQPKDGLAYTLETVRVTGGKARDGGVAQIATKLLEVSKRKDFAAWAENPDGRYLMSRYGHNIQKGILEHAEKALTLLEPYVDSEPLAQCCDYPFGIGQGQTGYYVRLTNDPREYEIISFIGRELPSGKFPYWVTDYYSYYEYISGKADFVTYTHTDNGTLYYRDNREKLLTRYTLQELAVIFPAAKEEADMASVLEVLLNEGNKL